MKNCKLQQNLAKIHEFNIFGTISLSQETIRNPCFKPEIVSQAHKDRYTWNIQIFQKFQKFKFIQKLLKLDSKKNVYNHLINSRNYFKTLDEVPGPPVPEENQKHEKMNKYFKKLLKFVILKS